MVKRTRALKRMTLVHPWKDMILPQLIQFSQTPKRATLLHLFWSTKIPASQGVAASEILSSGAHLWVHIWGESCVHLHPQKSGSARVTWVSTALSSPEGWVCWGLCPVVGQHWKCLKCAHGGGQIWPASFRSQISGKKQDSLCSSVVLSATPAVVLPQ